MAREPIPDLFRLLQVFDEEVQVLALKLRALVLDIFPGANELIYDNYNALAIGYSLSDKQKDMFCHIAVYSKHVNLGFDQGVGLDDPQKMLKGTGTRIRHITVTAFAAFQADYAKDLLQQAHQLALEDFGNKPPSITGQSIVKSVSANKKRPF